MLAAAVKGSPEKELAGKIAGPLIGGVIAAGATVVADADKVKSGKMTAAAATADVIVEGATGAATALIGAEAGAAAGAALGSIIPGLGTVVGGAVGALVGGVAGYVAGQEAHSSGILDGAKKQIGGALAGAEQPLKAGWMSQQRPSMWWRTGSKQPRTQRAGSRPGWQAPPATSSDRCSAC